MDIALRCNLSEDDLNNLRIGQYDLLKLKPKKTFLMAF